MFVQIHPNLKMLIVDNVAIKTVLFGTTNTNNECWAEDLRKAARGSFDESNAAAAATVYSEV